MKLIDAIGLIIDCDETIAIWKEVTYRSTGAATTLVWKGAASKLPRIYHLEEMWKVFTVTPADLIEGNPINIKILPPPEGG